MKQRKIAISLAVVGAIAAPFALKTYKMRPTAETLVPLTSDERDGIEAYLKRTNNCETLSERLHNNYTVELDAEELLCRWDMRNLKNGQKPVEYISAPKYLGYNAAAMVVGFGSIFGLTFLLPALVRRYWQWLNT